MGRISDVFVLKASGLIEDGADNATPVIDVSSYEVGGVFINVTAKSGTFTDWLFALQVSMNGTDFSGIGTASSAQLTSPASLGAATDISATGKYWFPVNSFAGPYARLAWVLTGGTSVTFSASAAFRRAGTR